MKLETSRSSQEEMTCLPLQQRSCRSCYVISGLDGREQIAGHGMNQGNAAYNSVVISAGIPCHGFYAKIGASTTQGLHTPKSTVAKTPSSVEVI